MTDYKVNKLIGSENSKIKIRGSELIINFAEKKEIPQRQKDRLVKHFPLPNKLKYIKYAEINMSFGADCIYSSIKHDGKYIALGCIVRLGSGKIDTSRIKFYVYTLPDMIFVNETEHTMCGDVYISSDIYSSGNYYLNGGIQWLDEESGYNYYITNWSNLYTYHILNRPKVYIHGYDYNYGKHIIHNDTMGTYKYFVDLNKAQLDVYMNVLDAEPRINDELFNKYSPDVPGRKSLKQCMLESVFLELPPELITGILGYIPIEDKLELLLS